MKTIYCLFAVLIVSQAPLAQPTTFSSRGPGGGGALFSPSFNPSDANELYLACDMSELFRSTDLGATWAIPDFRQLQSQKMASVQYCNGGVRFAIDGSTINGTDNMRPMKSTDNGATWKALVNDATANNAYTIFADPANNQHVLMSDYNSMYFSNNGGTSFVTMYHTNNNAAGLALGGAFFEGNNIYIGTNEGVIVSTNGGTSFDTAHINGIPSTEKIVSFTAAKQGSTTRFFCVTNSGVYAGITGADHYSYRSVYRSDWGSGMWTKVVSGIDPSAHPFYISMGASDINIAYLAGGSTGSAPIVYKTTDGGGSWNSVFQTTNNQNIYTGWSGQGGDRQWSYGEYALGFQVAPGDPTHVAITDLGYAHITSDGGATWHAAYVPQSDWNDKGSATPKGRSYHSIGLENTSCWNIAWFDKNNMFGCYSDIQGTRSTDGGVTWGFNYSGHTDNTMYHAIKVTDASSPSGYFIYGATSSVHDMYQSTTLTDARIDGGKGKVIYSTDNGETWQLEHDFAHPVIWVCASPDDPHTLYASVIHSTAGGIYVTHNAHQGSSSTWVKLTNPPRTEGHPLNIRVLKNGNLLASFSGRRTSNFTASSGVFLSVDGGTTWQDKSDDRMKYWTWDVVVDPYDPSENTWYAGVFSGWGGQANGLGGLYKTTNGGSSWVMMKSLQGVTSITFSPNNQEVMYVTTEVDGLWYCGNRHDPSYSLVQIASYPFRQPMRVFYNPFDSTEIWVSSFGNGMRIGKTVEQGSVPSTVILVSPGDKTYNATIPRPLQWQPASGAESYHIQVATDNAFSKLVLDSTTVGTTTLTVNQLDSDMTYYWRVRGSNGNGNGPWSAIWTFNTAVVVKLIYPPNNSTNIDTQVTFLWHKSRVAESYALEISEDSNFNTSGTVYNIADSFYVNKGLLKGNTKYYWHISAVLPKWPETWNFTTKPKPGPAPETVILIYPEDHSNPLVKVDELPPYGLVLKWNTVAGATGYHLIITHDSLLQDIVFNDSTIIDTTHFFEARNDSTYWWKVSARNESGWGPWSDQWMFSNVTYLGVSDDRPQKNINLSLYPNPASSDVTIAFELPEPDRVRIELFDELGRKQKEITSGTLEQGKHTLNIDVSHLILGSYYLKFAMTNFSRTIPLVLAK